MQKLLYRLGLWGLLFAFIAGCSSEAPTAGVHGKITVAGKPVGPGSILFQPDAPPGDFSRPNASMKFGADGTYAGTVPVGKHKIIIQSPQDEEAEAKGQLPKSQIPLRYNDPDASQLKAEVKDADNTLDFDLKPR